MGVWMLDSPACHTTATKIRWVLPEAPQRLCPYTVMSLSYRRACCAEDTARRPAAEDEVWEMSWTSSLRVTESQASEMPRVPTEVPAAKPDDLRLLSGSHEVKGQDQLP